jgi:hypothetical protein
MASNKKWHGKMLLNIGVQHNDYKNGLLVNVPEGYTVIWISCSNHVWGRFYVTYEDGGKRQDLGNYTCGHRQLNEISPDGGAPNTSYRFHHWMPIPIKKAGAHIIHSGRNSNGWISGIAFSKNLWNHARMSAVGIHWAVNGLGGCSWHTHNWNNDNLARFNARGYYKIRVPVVENGKDKLLYLIEHNNNWVGVMHSGVKINRKEADRFSTGWTNPFATHFNSKFYDRYVALRVPKELIKAGDLFLDVEISMRDQDHHIHFREMGTHDTE